MKLARAFSFAWNGLKYCIKTQQNFRIHLIIGFGVTLTGLIVKINLIEWLFIIGCATMVLVLELVNTAIEKLCDTITIEIHPSIKIIKDVSAAAVLLAALSSVLTGLIIFGPRFFNLGKLYFGL